MTGLRQPLLHILQHSLGLDDYGRGKSYRNRFVTGPECDNYADCRELVAQGFMVEHAPREIFGGMSCFVVTKAGKDAVREQSPRPPKRTRSQQRYERFLRADCGMTFHEWIKQEAAK